MGNGINKAIIVGNLGADPEIKYLPNGTAICNISVATTDSWKDKTTGEKVEKTEWHRCSAFGRLAEIMGEYLKKGSQVYIEGSIETRKWQAEDGTDRYSTGIKVREMRMLSGRDSGNQNSGGGQGGGGFRDNRGAQQGTTAGQQSAPTQTTQGQQDAFSDDDIPF